MAFLKAMPESVTDRFSMLLLEPGEIFLLDLAVQCYPFDVPEPVALERCQKGRLKVCTKSIAFDPEDTKLPIQRFPYREMLEIRQWNAPLLTRLGTDSTNFYITTKQYIMMKAGNVVSPFVFKREQRKLMFRLVHSKVDECLRYMSQLHRASELHGSEQSYMITTFISSLLSRRKFDYGRLESFYEKIIEEKQCVRVTPLITNPGYLMLTDKLLYFQPFNDYGPVLMLKIKLSDIKRVFKRRFLLRHEAVEIYCKENYRTRVSHVYLSLTSEADRNEFYARLLEQSDVKLEDPGQENMTYRWQNGVVSNYDYLMYLNSMADRSINDLTQYPVFPWVISNYTSETLDLTDESNYRDLTKPVGALNEERLKKLLERYAEMPEPKFLYGSHYSSPGHVLFYLARAAPEYVLCLHNGSFDHPDRMFNSVADTYRNVLTSTSDFKELIPEFYSSDGKFLKNQYCIGYGNRQSGRPVTDVELPPWASDVEDFISKMREALESEYVSKNLHHWIDLIFGYKQNGEEALLANNLFCHLTYEGAVDVRSVRDSSERSSLETQIAEFGQTPTQIFTQPHPQRIASRTISASNEQRTSSNSSSGSLSHSVPASITSEPTEDVAVVRQHSEPAVFDQSINEVSSSCGRFDLCNLQRYSSHNLHGDNVSDVRWGSEIDDFIYSSSKDGTLRIYSQKKQDQFQSVTVSRLPFSSFALLPSERRVILGCWDNNIYLYNIDYARCLETVYAHDDAVSQLSLNDKFLASASWDSSVKLWDCSNREGNDVKLKLTMSWEHDTSVYSVAQNSDSSRLVSGTKEGQLCLWDPTSLHPVYSNIVHKGAIHSVTFSEDFTHILSCGDDGFVQIFDSRTTTHVFQHKTMKKLRCSLWNDRQVLIGCDDGDLLVWDMVNGKIIKTIPSLHNGPVNCFDFSRSVERRLLIGGADSVVSMWSA